MKQVPLYHIKKLLVFKSDKVKLYFKDQLFYFCVRFVWYCASRNSIRASFFFNRNYFIDLNQLQFILSHTTIDDSWMLPCMNKTLLGADCPGCGIQRSISLLMQGKIVDSFFMYPALFPMIFLFLFLTFDFFMKIKYSEKIKLSLVVLTLGAVFINFGIKLLTN